tara:strand:- start:324 stop:524 length:201 start_codon:yes stop_codon:yes gene_type:complete
MKNVEKIIDEIITFLVMYIVLSSMAYGALKIINIVTNTNINNHFKFFLFVMGFITLHYYTDFKENN